jgi:hypothetical protein
MHKVSPAHVRAVIQVLLLVAGLLGMAVPAWADDGWPGT